MNKDEANSLRLELLRYMELYGKNVREKFENIVGKAGQHGIPEALWLYRTDIDDRILIPWKTVCSNNLTYEQLCSIENGVTIEFINDDYYNDKYLSNDTYNKLKEKLGSNEKVSSIISIRKESGDSSSKFERSVLDHFFNNVDISYNNQIIRLNMSNIGQYAIHRVEQCAESEERKGIGNEKWSGFLFVSIKGGSKESIDTHRNDKKVIKEYLFNPSCEYANSTVKMDLLFVLGYYALKSIKINAKNNNYKLHKKILNKIEEYLKGRKYDFEKYKGDLLRFCKKHYCVRFKRKYLIDPILMKKIEISDFLKKDRDSFSIDLAHNEAIEFEKYYWDEENKCILSPTRPTNVFWSFHKSNMMQQNSTLDDFFKSEKKQHNKRRIHELMNKVLRRNING